MLVRANLNLTFAKAGEIVEVQSSSRVRALLASGRLTEVGADGQPKASAEPENLTVAELREALDARGIEAPAGARKDDLVALLDGSEAAEDDEPEEG